MLKVACLASGIKARLHIESQLKSLKKEWQTAYNIVNGVKYSTSGFGHDPVTKMVTAPDDVWDAYVVVNPDAKPWRTKSFFNFEACTTIFGNDRAKGDESKNDGDALEKTNNEGDSASNKEDEPLPTEIPTTTCCSSRSRSNTEDVTSTPRNRKMKLLPKLVIQEGIVKATQIVADEISKAAGEISKATAGIGKAISHNQDIRDLVVEALGVVEGMSEVDKFTYGPRIMARLELMAAF